MIRSLDKSHQLYEEAKHSLAGGVSSHFRTLGRPHPMFFERASGARIWDVDGNEYLDFTLSQGPLILGHSHPELLSRVTEMMSRGQLFAGQFEEEVEAARRMTELLPEGGLVRFCNSGSEAVHTAIRLARAVTGKKKILKFEGHYHGWLDNVLISVNPGEAKAGPAERPCPVPWTQGQPASVLDEVVVRGWNDAGAVERLLAEDSDIAAVLTEPIMCNTGCILPEPGYMQLLREQCTRKGILLIFDEIITGFRVAAGGAQQYLGITADLVTYGKAMASGFPISAIAGRRRFLDYIADGRVMHAGTLNANNMCIAATLATLEILARDGGEAYRHITQIGSQLMEGLRRIGQRHGHPIQISGPGPMFFMGFGPRPMRNYRDSLSYDTGKLQDFVFGMLQRGVRLIGRGLWYVSLAHSEADVEQALAAAEETMAALPPSQ